MPTSSDELKDILYELKDEIKDVKIQIKETRDDIRRVTNCVKQGNGSSISVYTLSKIILVVVLLILLDDKGIISFVFGLF